MNIFVSGVNYRTMPLEIRERMSFNRQERADALRALMRNADIKECIMLSTCNRTEVYVYSENAAFDSGAVEDALCSFKGMETYGYKKYFYFYAGVKAARHIFKVSCGLDSMVLGEDQILGQVKEALELSMQTNSSSVVLNTLFREAITAAKEIKTTTGLSRSPVSIGSLAVKFASDIFGGDLKNRTVMLIGTGKIGVITLKNLESSGVQKIYVTNRTHGRSLDVTKLYANAVPVEYNERYGRMDECDIVISSTSSPHYTITQDMLQKSLITPKTRVFIDLAVPRDMDAGIKAVEKVMYLNIDDFHAVKCENMGKRMDEAAKAERIIDSYLADFERWHEFQSAIPLVKEVREYSYGMVNEKLDQSMSRLKNVSEEDRELVKSSMAAAVESILNKLVYSVRDYGDKEDIKAYFRCVNNALHSK